MRVYERQTIDIPARQEHARRHVRTECDVCGLPITQPVNHEDRHVTVCESAVPAYPGHPVRTTSFDCCPDCFGRHILPVAKRHIVETSEASGSGWHIAPTSTVVDHETP